MITPFQRDALIEHLDGPVTLMRRGGNREEAALIRRRRDLLNWGLLRYDRPDFPRLTILTEKGRAKLAEALADWADALIRAGHDGVNGPETIAPVNSPHPKPEILPSWPFRITDRPIA